MPELAGHGRRGTSPHVAQAMLRLLRPTDGLTLALPPGPRSVTSHWERLAAANDVRCLHLGTGGWVRIETNDGAFRFTSIDVPIEVMDPASIICLLRAERAREPFDFWPAIVHPHTAFRAEAGKHRDHLVVELACARSAHWLLDLTPGGGAVGPNDTAILGITDDIVAAELCILATQQLGWMRFGYEERGSWEHPRIQAACELGLGIDGGHRLVLGAHSGDDPAARMAERIARRLDCKFELLDQ